MFAPFIPVRASTSSFFWLFFFFDVLSSTLLFSLSLPICAFYLPILSEVWHLTFLQSKYVKITAHTLLITSGNVWLLTHALGGYVTTCMPPTIVEKCWNKLKEIYDAWRCLKNANHTAGSVWQVTNHCATIHLPCTATIPLCNDVLGRHVEGNIAIRAARARALPNADQQRNPWMSLAKIRYNTL